MKTTSWMAVVMAGLSLLPACGGEELPTMEPQVVLPDTENLGETSSELSYTYFLGIHGGGGGSPTTIPCPSGYVAVGLHGRSGWYIDQVGFLCQRLKTNGDLDTAYYKAPLAGGSGGTSFEMKCPQGQAIVGFQGRSGGYVDQLGFYCSTPVNQIAGAAPQYESSLTGSGGGSNFWELCPASYVVTSFNVRSGGYVDQVQGVCSYISHNPGEPYVVMN